MALGITFSAGQFLTASSLMALVDAARNSTAGINGQALSAGASETTTSATFVNCAGTGSTTSFSWTKKRSDTDALLKIDASALNATANAYIRFALRINGTDYELAGGAAGTIQSDFSGERVVSGIPAGTYTVQVRWRRSAGAGTPTRNENCWLSASVTECN
jgi:hypothetical protein